MGLHEAPRDEECSVSQKFMHLMEKSPKAKRRMLELVLLCSGSLDASQVSLVATFLHIDEYELATMISKLLESGYRRLEIVEHLRSTRDLHYFRVMNLERELSYSKSVDADPQRKSYLLSRLHRERRFLALNQADLRSRPGIVTHAMVASITGVPKGTIDSGMHSLKKMVKRIMDDPS